MKLTLDWNCVIEVEEERLQAPNVMALIEAHRCGEFEVALLAASASENTKSMRFPGDGKIFEERVKRLNWEDLPIVPMPAVIGLSYFDFCYWIGDGEAFERDFDALWKIIAPNLADDPKEYLGSTLELTDEVFQSEKLSRWRNAWCDVMSAYSHIHEKRDLFVTLNTKDFQRNADALKELGMNTICEPKEVSAVIEKVTKV